MDKHISIEMIAIGQESDITSSNEGSGTVLMESCS
jgi:hypothetical protein